MIWWAYAGFSGAILISVVLMALTMGMPSAVILQLTVAIGSVMLGGAMFASLCLLALRRRRP